ncbi:hypothetical protein EV426DRAFT_239994 [Tirmania nivea]|nr:hypothetical protein EV426DRAFT_239994 [Tirmania nivea]
MDSTTAAHPMKRSHSLFRLFSRRSSISVTTPDVLPGVRERTKSFSAKPSRQRTMSIASSSPLVPQEIHDNIIRFLRASHENGKEATCSTCLARDLSAYSLVRKSWHRAAMPHMYAKIWVNGAESSTAMKKAKKKAKETSRAVALLRTLTARPDYAALVKELKLPEYNRETTPEANVLKLFDTAAAIIQCTPNLERFLGPYSSVGGGWSNVVNKALSGCISLREQVLIFNENKSERSKLERSREFASMHERWMNLETLVLQGCGQEPDVDFVGAFVNLPKLKNLMISSFILGESAALALQAIPDSVESLRLEKLQGLTGRTLHGFAISRKTKGLSSLALVNIRMARIQDLISLFRLPNLKSLTIADSTDTPYFDETEMTNDFVEQISNLVFCSLSLESLHWDILVHPLVETALANSISGGRLPALRTLRAPSDRVGTLQAVCKPRESISLASDFIYESPTRTAHPTTSSAQNAPSVTASRPPSHKSTFLSPGSAAPSPNVSRRSSINSQASSSPTSSNPSSTASPSVATLKAFGKSKPEFQPFPRTLHSARLRAQKRIERARQETLIQIMISEEGITKETISLRRFMGDVKSKVTYSLIPAPLRSVSGKDEDARAGGRECALVSFESDIIDGSWRREVDIGSGVGKEVCYGGWNLKGNGKDGAVVRKDKKSLGKILHEERRKVEGGKVELEKLF